MSLFRTLGTYTFSLFLELFVLYFGSRANLAVLYSSLHTFPLRPRKFILHEARFDNIQFGVQMIFRPSGTFRVPYKRHCS